MYDTQSCCISKASAIVMLALGVSLHAILHNLQAVHSAVHNPPYVAVSCNKVTRIRARVLSYKVQVQVPDILRRELAVM